MKPKRKIIDLKENECIHIRNEREAKGFAKLADTITNTTLNEKCGKTVLDAFNNYGKETIISYNKTDVGEFLTYLYVAFFIENKGTEYGGDTVYPASDFLPSKRKNSKLWKEITRLDGRVRELEQYKAQDAFDATYKKAEDLFNHDDNFTKFWCILNTADNKDLITNYFGKEYRLNTYIHQPTIYMSRDFDEVKRLYTEITTEQFEKYVLKRDDLSEVEKSKEIDWKAKQTLTDGHFVVGTTGNHSKTYFEGVVLRHPDDFNLYITFDNLLKSDFKPYEGTNLF